MHQSPCPYHVCTWIREPKPSKISRFLHIPLHRIAKIIVKKFNLLVECRECKRLSYTLTPVSIASLVVDPWLKNTKSYPNWQSAESAPGRTGRWHIQHPYWLITQSRILAQFPPAQDLCGKMLLPLHQVTKNPLWKFNLLAVSPVWHPLSDAPIPMSIACLYLDPWAKNLKNRPIFTQSLPRMAKITFKKFSLLIEYVVWCALPFAVSPMSIACLWVDPWLKILDFPPYNFVVSGCRSLWSPFSPCTKASKNHLKNPSI
jgi:hypothetical protein